MDNYPTHIINQATQSLWMGNGRPGESYHEFLKRVWTDFDVPSKCKEMAEIEGLDEMCEYCDTPVNAPNFAYHFCTGRKENRDNKHE